MANIRLWRQISLWLWLSCLLLAVYSAPVNEEESISITNDNQNNGDLGAAIEAVRAKRDTRKKSSKAGRNLVRYRYPIQMKRSGGIGQSDQDYQLLDGESGMDEDERDQTLAALLGGEELLARTDNDIDLDELAKEIALDILMEEADKGRTSQHRSSGSGSLMKKKKAAPTAHRPRYLSLDDKRRKRMNSLVNQLLSQDYDDNNHQDDEQQQHSAAGPLDNDEDLFGEEEEDEEEEGQGEGEEEDEPRDQDPAQSRTMLRELASQGLDRHEIDALLSQLERSRDELKPENKKRSSEWRKLPRASLRWRFLHSLPDNNEPTYGRHQSEEEPESAGGPLERQQDKTIPLENRYFGRGFHRVGPHIQEDLSRPSVPAAAKRVQHPLKTKNAVSLINKRSISMQNSQQNDHQESISRKRRSPSTTSSGLKANQTTELPLALPVVEPKNGNSSEPAKESGTRKLGAHSGVIRKKSVDWDDYFGYDKRSKSDNSEDEAMKDFLQSEYYKSLGGSVGFRKRAGDDHSSHFGGMKKRNNGTVSMLKKRGANLEDAQEALDAAFRVVQQRRERDNLERVREQLVAELIENLDEDELDQMTEQLSEELAEAIRQDEEEGVFDDEDESLAIKRSPVHKLKYKKKKNVAQNDERRKRFAIKRSQKSRHRPEIEDKDDCVIAEQVVVTCNMVSHLYGGYRPVLSDACFRHQACFICSDNEAVCDAEFQHRVLALCGSDLLCQSQSRHLLSALGQLDQMEADYLGPLGGRARIDTLCRRDSCLAEFWKRR